MNNELLKDYARLIARKGVNVEKGEEVWIYCGLSDAELTRLVAKECYEAGAKRVVVKWMDDGLDRINYTYMSSKELAKVTNYNLAELKYQLKNTPSRLFIDSMDPEAMAGLDQKKIIASHIARRKKTKKYSDLLDGKQKWCIVGAPSKKWATKVFPDVSEDEAMEKLWDAILYTTRVDGNDPVENWNKHNANLTEKKTQLTNMNLQYLVYKSNNGTDFKVELIDGAEWGAGLETTNLGKEFNPNMPSEEVFTSPKAGSCEGIVYSTKPLSYNGELIKNFNIRFTNGKVSEVHAEQGEELLKQMVSMDEGASMLGEVALVPFDSPINNSGTLFYSTLYDENAACHLAIGHGFKELLPNGRNISTEEAKKMGINDSITHVDFMIGSEDLSIVGITRDGKEIQIFKDGNWAF